MPGTIKVLVVDDSPFMRRAISRMVMVEPDFEIVGTANNGMEALEQIKKLKPDVMTLDIEMPVLDGIATLRRLQELKSSLPVIMMSSLTKEGSSATLQALEAGAFDFVPKPDSSILDVFSVARELVEKIRAATQARYPSSPPRAHSKLLTRGVPDAGILTNGHIDIVAIGISTGGPPALQAVLPQLPRDFPIPIVIVQHMPPGFTKPLAERLNQLCKLRTKEAEAGELVVSATAYIAPAGWHMELTRSVRGITVRLIDSSSSQTWYKPSVNVLLDSIAATFGQRALAIIMTGMGNDGTAGATAMKRAGALVWAQDEASSTVYGMPRAIAEAGIADRLLSLTSIATELCRLA